MYMKNKLIEKYALIQENSYVNEHIRCQHRITLHQIKSIKSIQERKHIFCPKICFKQVYAAVYASLQTV